MIIDRSTIVSFVDSTLTDISRATPSTHTHACFHCGLPIRYPVIARAQDVEDFTALMESAYRIMDKYGITQNLLAEIKAGCLIEIARRSSLK